MNVYVSNPDVYPLLWLYGGKGVKSIQIELYRSHSPCKHGITYDIHCVWVRASREVNEIALFKLVNNVLNYGLWFCAHGYWICMLLHAALDTDAKFKHNPKTGLLVAAIYTIHIRAKCIIRKLWLSTKSAGSLDFVMPFILFLNRLENWEMYIFVVFCSVKLKMNMSEESWIVEGFSHVYQNHIMILYSRTYCVFIWRFG